jgi:hypothetical protein
MSSSTVLIDDFPLTVVTAPSRLDLSVNQTGFCETLISVLVLITNIRQFHDKTMKAAYTHTKEKRDEKKERDLTISCGWHRCACGSHYNKPVHSRLRETEILFQYWHLIL